MHWRDFGLRPDAVYRERVLGESFCHICERYTSIVAEMQKVLFRTRCQVLKCRPNISFCDLFMRFPDHKEWLLS